MEKRYQKTLIACYLGFITQAIAANFAPLLFITFHKTYHIPLGKIALISTFFYFTQLLVDLACVRAQHFWQKFSTFLAKYFGKTGA